MTGGIARALRGQPSRQQTGGIRGTFGGEFQMMAAVRPEAADGGVGTTMQRWYVLLMMVLVYTLSIADRYVISTVLERIPALPS